MYVCVCVVGGGRQALDTAATSTSTMHQPSSTYTLKRGKNENGRGWIGEEEK